jgi:hypothetical protein
MAGVMSVNLAVGQTLSRTGFSEAHTWTMKCRLPMVQFDTTKNRVGILIKKTSDPDG